MKKEEKGHSEEEKKWENPVDRWIASVKNPVLREILEWVEMLLVAAVIALFINNVLIANSTIPTESMESTINAGDRVIGSRLSYVFGEPERGDIAIFRYGWKCSHCGAEGELPAADTCPSCGKSLKFCSTIYYVKRVIGLPGDTVEIRADGACDQSEIISEASRTLHGADPEQKLVTAAVYVNGEKLTEDYLNEPMLYTGDLTYEVPEDSYFMLGDNRNCSKDARFWKNSYIPKERMVARVLFRYWKKLSLIK